MSIRSVTNEAADAEHFKKKRRTKKPQTLQEHGAATLDRLPPHSEEAERAVIGCALLSPVQAFSECQELGVRPSWFYALPHQVVWDAIEQMSKIGVVIDLISLQQYLKDAGQLVEIGGVAYLSQCQDEVPSVANLGYYTGILKEKFQLRTMVQLCSGMVGRIYDYEGEVPALVSEFEKEALKLSESHVAQAESTARELMPAVIDDLENYHRGSAQIRGLKTGLSYVDKMLGGSGGEDNNMIVLAARPGMGKTSVALDITLHVSLDHEHWVANPDAPQGPFLKKNGMPVAIFSLEMTKKALMKRMLFQRARADLQRWRTGFAEAADFPPLIQAGSEISRAKIFIDDTARCTIDELKARARRLKRQHGIRLFVVDYIQLLKSNERRFRDDRVQELAEISGELQKLGKELETPFIILAQMNRDYEKEPNREPRLSDLKDCGAIEQDADIVAFLHTPKKANEEDIYVQAMERKFGNDWAKYPKRVDLLIAKARNGPTGPCQLLFQKSCTHFYDWWDWRKNEGVTGDAPALDLPSNEEIRGGE